MIVYRPSRAAPEATCSLEHSCIGETSEWYTPSRSSRSDLLDLIPARPFRTLGPSEEDLHTRR
jgi:hypothetical protein